ncbi:MAG TPA: SsrA-binding protein SmpB [Firmicutes bacterium]|nr:SsrA-binding protein SmpB [Bacillota bacterium]
MEKIKIVTENRKARHDYFVEDTIEAGIALVGSEVKSLRLGRANLKDSYAEIKGREVFLRGMHIAPYEYSNRFNHDPLRARKLLLHKHEILKLASKVRERGYTLVPLKVYFKRGIAKVELALAKGKKSFDRRADIAERDAKRAIERAIKAKR